MLSLISRLGHGVIASWLHLFICLCFLHRTSDHVDNTNQDTVCAGPIYDTGNPSKKGSHTFCGEEAGERALSVKCSPSKLEDLSSIP